MFTAAFRSDFDPAAAAGRLGLSFSDKDLFDGKRLYDSATRVLQEWEARRTAAARRIDGALRELSSTSPESFFTVLERKSYELVLEGYRAGLRSWLWMVSFSTAPLELGPRCGGVVGSILATVPQGVPKSTPTDLRMWCLLQLKAIEDILPRAYPAPTFLWRESQRPAKRGAADPPPTLTPEIRAVLFEHSPSPRSEDILLGDLMLLHEVAWLFAAPGADEPAGIDRVVYTLGHLFWTWQGGVESDSLRTTLTYPVVVKHAWAAMRELATTLNRGYPEEPGEVRDARACRNALDRVVAWCLEQEREPASAGPRPRVRLSRDEAEAAVRQYLREHPAPTAREVSKATGVALGRLSKFPAWQVYQAQKKASPTAATQRGPRTRPLTKKMLGAIGQAHDPSAGIEAEEAVWRGLLENAATPGERARLNAMKPEEKAKLIQACIEQREDEAEERGEE
jgi:hypothetical protein